MKLFGIVFLVLFFAILSCSNNNNEEIIDNPDDEVVEEPIIDDAVHPKDFNITAIDTAIGYGYLISRELQLDLNSDSRNDIKFLYTYDYSPGGLSFINSTIGSLNAGLKLSIKVLADTLKSCSFFRLINNDTIIYYWNFNTLATLNITNIISEKINKIQKVTLINDYPTYDSLKVATYTKILNNIDIAYHFGTLNYPIFEGDSIVGYTQDIFEHGCPAGKDFYCYFELTNDSIKKLGWIKMKLEGFSNVSILEYAIEK